MSFNDVIIVSAIINWTAFVRMFLNTANKYKKRKIVTDKRPNNYDSV